MKKAFSLFELIITLALLGVIFVVFAKPVMNLTRLYTSTSHNEFGASLVFIDKILQNCLEFTLTAQGFECLLKDTQNLILQRQNTLFIGNSGVILKDENATLYAPKSHFVYEIQSANGKSLKAGVLENQKDTQGVKNGDLLYLYALKERQIYTAQVFDENTIRFVGDEFVGFYELIDARISVGLRQDELLYHYQPYAQSAIYTGVLAHNVKDFRVEQNIDAISLELCASENFCLKKWVKR